MFKFFARAGLLAGSGLLLFAGAFPFAPAASADDVFEDIKKPLFQDGGLFGDKQKETEKKPAYQTPEECQTNQVKTMQVMARREAQKEMLLTCDNELFRQMQSVSDWMNNYVVMNHRFPEQYIGGEDPYNMTFGQGDQMTIAMQQMNILIPNNPYVNGGIYMQPGEDVNPGLENSDDSPVTVMPSDSKFNQNRIKVIYDRSLNPAGVAELAQHPPYEWTASPGTVCFVTDSLYYFIVWGAGADGKPIRDPVSGNARLVLGNYNTWDQPLLHP